MKELVFLVEGEAERNLLNALMPRLLPEEIGHRVIPFQGKQDLEKRMAMRIRCYQNSLARFIILRDQESHADCVALKQGLLARCEDTGKAAHCLVRIACAELETFYLADLAAVAQALDLPKFRTTTLHQASRDINAVAAATKIDLKAFAHWTLAHGVSDSTPLMH